MFTFTNPRALSPEESSPYNNLLSNALKNYKGIVSARYAPQMHQADIIGKALTPLANIAMSPLAQAFMPQQKQMVNQYISQVLAGLNNQNQQNPLSSLLGFGQHQNQAQSMPNAQQGINETGQDYGNEVGQRFTEKQTQEQTSPGMVYQSNGQRTISPTGSAREETQQAIIGKRKTSRAIAHILSDIKQLDKKGIGNTLQKGALGLEGSGLPYISDIAAAGVPKTLREHTTELEDALVNYFKYSPESAHNIVRKGISESIPAYSKRIEKLEKELEKQEKFLTSSLEKGGYNLSNEQANHNEELENENIEKPIGAMRMFYDPKSGQDIPVLDEEANINEAKRLGLKERK